MAYTRLDTEYVDGKVWDEKAVTKIDDAIEGLIGSIGETESLKSLISLNKIGANYQVSGAIKGSIGEKIITSATTYYHYIITDIGAADSFLVETFVSTSNTYLNYGFVLDSDDNILATYGENDRTSERKFTFTIDNFPAGAAKIAVLIFSNNKGRGMTIYPSMSQFNLSKYLYVMNDKLVKADELTNALDFTTEVVQLDTITDTSAEFGGLKGAIGAALEVTSTNIYKYLIIDIGEATQYKVTTQMSTSTAYPYYAFALNDNNVILQVYGENETYVARKASFEVIDIPKEATKMAFLNNCGSSGNGKLTVIPYQTAYHFANLNVTGGAVGGTAITNGIKAQLDVKRPIIIDRNSSKKYLNIVHITDTHLEEENQTGLIDILTANQLASEGWIDFIVHGGDIFNSYASGSTNGSQGITKAQALARIDDCLSNLKDAKCPIYIARGNHDVNGKYMPNYPDSTAVDTTQIISQTAFNLVAQRGLRGAVDGEYKCSFYKDFADEKVRVILLDSYATDTQSATATKDVMQFLANALKLESGKRDYSVVVFCHTLASALLTYYSPLFLAFKNGTTFSDSKYGVSADYTSQGSGSFIGAICGHSHGEHSDADYGYWNLQTSTSYLKTSDVVSDNIYATVYTFDTDNHIIYKEKLGNGGTSAAYNWDTLTKVTE
jgi:predicted MPP superfamily phosphohydrolase